MTGENMSTENARGIHLQERASREPEVSYSHGAQGSRISRWSSELIALHNEYRDRLEGIDDEAEIVGILNEFLTDTLNIPTMPHFHGRY